MLQYLKSCAMHVKTTECSNRISISKRNLEAVFNLFYLESRLSVYTIVHPNYVILKQHEQVLWLLLLSSKKKSNKALFLTIDVFANIVIK